MKLLRDKIVKNSSFFIKSGFLVFSVILHVSCAPMIENRGFDFEIYDFSQLHPGQTKEEVLKILGSPSAVSTFKDQDWYYISKKALTSPFKDPKIMDYRVMVISFDATDRIRSIQEKSQADIDKVKPAPETTEITGYESSVLRDIFGNFGKFNTNGHAKAPTKS